MTIHISFVFVQWKCCDVHVKEFDEFLEIPPCAKGWHDANPQDAA